MNSSVLLDEGSAAAAAAAATILQGSLEASEFGRKFGKLPEKNLQKALSLMGKVGVRKCAKREQLPEDYISQLPHEILVHILSYLTFKEAVRTSVLSKCWTNLWTYSARLDFFDFSALQRMDESQAAEYKSVRKRERRKFVKWVNKVLQSHKALALDEFRVHFNLKRSSQKAIDKWLQFAFARNVQRLTLDLSEHGSCGYFPKAYAFPYGPLGISGKSLESNSFALIDFKSLKALSLTRVNVSGEVLKFILHHCQYLEHLVVRDSNDLINVEVSGPLALKHLEICFCFNIECLTIHDANLVSLKISCIDTLVLKNVPMLADVYVYSYSRGGVRGIITRLSCCLLKLQVLSLLISFDEVKQLKEMLHELPPQLPKLKQLTLDVSAEEDESLIGLTSLIRVFPNLEKLVIKMWWDSETVIRPRKLGKAINHSLQHLEVLELSGFLGCTSEIELVKYFLENAVALEKIIIDPHQDWGDFCCPELESEFKEATETEKCARKRAKRQLNRLIIPSHVELVIM
ncbi:hypothetical protein ACH5RR_034241 [Cinchona calisaya]|uniref:F-box domain-containing protein n=1 Tax=Cinchona calisaya TaxID=153742 RepID=A0ABD2YEW0_9GENT